MKSCCEDVKEGESEESGTNGFRYRDPVRVGSVGRGKVEEWDARAHVGTLLGERAHESLEMHRPRAVVA